MLWMSQAMRSYFIFGSSIISSFSLTDGMWLLTYGDVRSGSRRWINVKKIAFVNKEHTTDKKMGVSVLLRLLISSNEVCNTAYTL